MADNPLSTLALKATYEMSETLFLPASVIILVTEFPSFLINKSGGGFFGAYFVYVFLAVIFSFVVIMVIGWFDTEKKYLAFFFTGVAVLPLGIFSVIPVGITGIQVPFHVVTGYCLIVWGLYLMYLFNSKRDEHA
jgi:hypothetical protein